MFKVRYKNIISIILVVIVCVAYFPIVTFDSYAKAQTISSVKTRGVSVKAGKYSMNVKQMAVDYRSGKVTLYKVKQLKKAKIKKVKITARMYYGKTVSRDVSYTKRLSKLSANNNTFKFSFPDFGKYKVTAKFYNKKGKRVKTVTLRNVGIIAEQYNIVALNGTFPNLLLTMSLWDITKSEKNRPIPTVVALTRHDAYNWNALPTNVYSNPLMKTPKTGGTGLDTKVPALSAYVKDLYYLNKNSKFHVYLTDNYPNGILELMCKNKIGDNNYKVTLLSDGSGSYGWFNSTFGGVDANKAYERMAGEWNLLKKAYLKGNYIDCTDVKYAINNKTFCMSKYTYPVVAESSNVDWWVGRKSGTFSSSDTDFLANAITNNTKLVEKNVNNMLEALKTKNVTAEFKRLYNFSDQMFSEAEKNKKKVMILMGTRVNLETNFKEFTSFIKQYYGSSYEYYYKGHPATPTKLYPEKQSQLAELGLHDIESSIAAEVILFFYPNVYCSGMSNSTLNFSYQAGKVGGYLGTRIANKGSITGGDLFQLFFTKINSSYEQPIKDLCDNDTSFEHSFLIEFKDTSKADIAIYDYQNKTISYYRLNGTVYEEVSL